MKSLFLLFLLLACLSIVKCKINNQKLSSILGELLELRSELNDLFKNPTNDYEDEGPSEEWVVHIERGVAEAKWIANLTNTQFVGPMRGFSDLYVFKSYSPQNKTETRRIKRDLRVRQRGNQLIWSELQSTKHRQKREILPFNDPLWKAQWEVNGISNDGISNDGSMRIAEAWAKGYTGRGIVVSILDDGVDWNHKDLADNYDPLASYDLNSNDNDPTPTMDEFNKHGTRCAGEVAMVANNSICGIGVAYNSKIGGIRMLDGKINDRLEAEALSILIDHVDIFSSSWGPTDDGLTVEGPGKLALMGLQKGVNEGRNGKGTIYVWASGNGGQIDDCSCDGYASSIYTFTVSGASSSNEFPWYGERCASALTTTFSSGSIKQKKIVTIDPQNLCADDHTGTSASAPLAAGIIALALEANPNLTWREVQHLAVWTSNPVSLFHVSGWQKNGVGLYSSTKFGFGLMDALEMTRMAKTLQPISPQSICTTTFPNFEPKKITNELGIVISFNLSGCSGQSNEIKSLEHVQLVVDIDSESRGLLSIWLESPSKMKSQLLHPRIRDNSTDGFKAWPFTSVQFWGEAPIGVWKIHVDQIKGASNNTVLKSILKNVTIILYGTSDIPKHAKLPRQYQNMTELPVSDSIPDSTSGSSPLANEVNVNIIDIEETIKQARQTPLSRSIESEKHLIAVDRLVRRINKMDMQVERRKRVTHIYANEI